MILLNLTSASCAARQLLSEAGGSVEDAVGIYFSSQHGNAAASSRTSNPTEQLQAVLGLELAQGYLTALLRDAHDDVQGAVNLHYHRQGTRWPLRVALLGFLALVQCLSIWQHGC